MGIVIARCLSLFLIDQTQKLEAKPAESRLTYKFLTNRPMECDEVRGMFTAASRITSSGTSKSFLVLTFPANAFTTKARKNFPSHAIKKRRCVENRNEKIFHE